MTKKVEHARRTFIQPRYTLSIGANKNAFWQIQGPIDLQLARTLSGVVLQQRFPKRQDWNAAANHVRNTIEWIRIFAGALEEKIKN